MKAPLLSLVVLLAASVAHALPAGDDAQSYWKQASQSAANAAAASGQEASHSCKYGSQLPLTVSNLRYMSAPFAVYTERVAAGPGARNYSYVCLGEKIVSLPGLIGRGDIAEDRGVLSVRTFNLERRKDGSAFMSPAEARDVTVDGKGKVTDAAGRELGEMSSNGPGPSGREYKINLGELDRHFHGGILADGEKLAFSKVDRRLADAPAAASAQPRP